MSEKKKQEYTTGGLKNRQDVEHALASAAAKRWRMH